MEQRRNRVFARGLSHFEAVWERVTAARPPRETAEASGVKLMPRQGRCSRRGGQGSGRCPRR